MLQRVRSWVADGKVTHAELEAVGELLASAEELPEDELVAGLAPVIQQDLRDQAVQAGIEAFSRKQDLDKVLQLEERARKFGTLDSQGGLGLGFGPGALRAIQNLKRVATLPYGIWELDNLEDSGLPRGGLGIFMAATGGGKSFALCHLAANTYWCFEGVVAYASLELPVEMVHARVVSNLLNVPVNELVRDPMRYEDRVEAVRTTAAGEVYVKKFTPLVTRVPDITRWVEELEQGLGRKVGLLVVDYGDKVGAPKKNGEDQNGYGTGLVVYEGLRNYAEQRDLFCWTASQANRKKDRRKRIDVDDVADSMHKVRVADMVISINPNGEDESKEVKFFLAKSRYGDGRRESNPVLTDYAHGRLGPPSHGCLL